MPDNRKFEHVVDVMRPHGPQGEESRDTPPALFREGVRCSINPMRGQEAERLSQMYATAVYTVGMYGDPSKQIKRVDQCIDQTGAVLNVMDIRDESRSQLGYIELICGEQPA